MRREQTVSQQEGPKDKKATVSWSGIVRPILASLSEPKELWQEVEELGLQLTFSMSKVKGQVSEEAVPRGETYVPSYTPWYFVC